jgi:isobutyryl-CoA mutase
LPIVGVNTFLHPRADEAGYCVPGELARATQEEKKQQVQNVRAFQELHQDKTPAAIKRLQDVAVQGGNIFAELMETVKAASLGQICHALYEVGGRYRRNM